MHLLRTCRVAAALVVVTSLLLIGAACNMALPWTGDGYELGGLLPGEGGTVAGGTDSAPTSGGGPTGGFGDADVEGGGEDAADIDRGGEDGDEPDGGSQAGTLTAGSFDDNLNYEVFHQFLSDVLQDDVAGQLPALTLGQRVIIRVVDEAGAGVPDARVVVAAANAGAEQPAFDQPTGSDGRVIFFADIDAAADAADLTVTVHPPDGSDPVSQAGDPAEGEWTVTLASAGALPTQLDLAFVVDATGSMGDELEYLKTEIDGIAAGVAERYPEVNQQYALIVYRDEGDLYVTRTFDFTADLAQFQSDLSDQQAGGGGDYPEAMHTALEAAEALTWRQTNTARVLFLVADAPPHTDEPAQRALDSVLRLRADGIGIYPVASSGVADLAEFIMRAAALMTGGQYLFLTDDSGVGNPHAEPHIPCYHVERLDHVMIRMIASELGGEPVFPQEEQIIRTVGHPVDGVCTEEQEDDPDPDPQ